MQALLHSNHEMAEVNNIKKYNLPSDRKNLLFISALFPFYNLLSSIIPPLFFYVIVFVFLVTILTNRFSRVM